MSFSCDPTDPAWVETAARRQLELTKPPGSLGRLEELTNRCVAIRESLDISVDRPRIVLFAANHGVCAEGVSDCPQEVTAQMVANFTKGGAAINAVARTGGIELEVLDVGIVPGTRNFCEAPAMTAEEMRWKPASRWRGRLPTQADSSLGFGEMGIGNTTAAGAITANLIGCPVNKVVGRGTGADEATKQRKRSGIERALTLHNDSMRTRLEVLQHLGGFEIAAMCWLRITPAAAGYVFASHHSLEPGHRHLLELIGQEPLLDLGMRLGDGTGAALAMGILCAAVATFSQMATFTSAGVSNVASPE